MCNANVPVVANLPPVALCQDFIAVVGPGGTVSITPGDIDAGSSDNCGIAMVIVPTRANSSLNALWWEWESL